MSDLLVQAISASESTLQKLGLLTPDRHSLITMGVIGAGFLLTVIGFALGGKEHGNN